MRIERLELKNWRNFKHIDVPVASRLVVVGANASGKSNFLDALRFLRDIARVGGGFQQALEQRGGVPRVRNLAARNYNGSRVVIAVHLREDDERWVYTLEFTREPRGKHRAIITSEAVRKGDEIVLNRPDGDDAGDSERMTQTALEQVNANKEFRAIVEFFASVRYRHLVPEVLRDPERGGDADDPFGGDFLLQIARTPVKTRDRRLARISTALAFAVPQLGELQLVKDADGTPHLQARFQHWRPSGASQTERDFSDGTIRLIGLLWALLDSGRASGPLLLEEPELSLHDDIVRQLPTLLAQATGRGGPQVFLTSHASSLLADEGLGANEVLLLLPGEEGTVGRLASDRDDVREMLDAGASLDEIVFPLTRPTGPGQLSVLPA